MSPGFERCPPAQPRGKGREARRPSSWQLMWPGGALPWELEEKPLPSGPGCGRGSATRAADGLTSCRGGSVLQWPREGVAVGRMARREGWGLRAPHPLPPSWQNRLWINNYSLFTSDHMALGNRCAGNEEPGSN